MQQQLSVKKTVINEKERFVIVDKDDNIVYDANGFGIKTRKKAKNCIQSMNGIVYVSKKKVEREKKLYIKQRTIDGKKRYIITGKKGKIINNNQGKGFKTIEAADKVIDYYFKHPLEDFIKSLIEEDKDFIKTAYEVLEYYLCQYAVKNVVDKTIDLNIINDGLTDGFIKALSERFDIDIFEQLKKTKTPKHIFIEIIYENI